MKKINPISLLEDTLLSLTDYLQNELIPEEQPIKKDFLKQLETENSQLLAFCKELNEDIKFVQTINSRLDLSNINALYKTEHIFLSEIIKIYLENTENIKPESQFVLAYYFDVLKNNHFANPNDLLSLNKLLKNEKFQEIIQDIIDQNSIKSISKEDNLLLTILLEMNHPKFQQMAEHFKNFSYFSLFPQKNEVEKPGLQENNIPKEKSNNLNISWPPEDDTLEKALMDLNGLIGLEEIKKDILQLINLLEVQKKRSEAGLKNIEISLHTVFLGPPGTGKTSVARLLSRIYKQLGYLSKGQLYETDREGLIAGYVGQTAIKTDQVIKESIGGVLFIDEAYGLTQNQNISDFGAEALNTIIKRMEDQREDLAIIVAGYTEPMQQFIDSNPGLRSRFSRYFHFNHFTTDQLVQIFENFCKNSDFVLSDDAKEKLKDTFFLIEELKSESFGNARFVRNLFEKIIQNQANRVVNWATPNPEFLKIIVEEDIPEPKVTLEQLKHQFIDKEN